MQTDSGFVCVQKVDPRPMCAPNTVPQTNNGRLECVPMIKCPPGYESIETESGTGCQAVTTALPIETTVTSLKTEEPCPYGLVPLQTSIERYDLL